MLGIAWADIDAKFRTLVPLGGLNAPRIEAALDIVHDFRRAGSVAPLLDQLCPGRT
jgi:hypothetical protein